MLSSGTSLSSALETHMPPGTSNNFFNITVVAYATDILGSTAVTSLGLDGLPLVIVSTLPEQVGYQIMVFDFYPPIARLLVSSEISSEFQIARRCSFSYAPGFTSISVVCLTLSLG